MVRFNIIYWLLIPLLCSGIYFLQKDMNNHRNELLGFAENKESEINLDFDVMMTKILVNTGDNVQKGQVLAEAESITYDEEIRQSAIRIKGLQIKSAETKAEIRAEIAKLEKDMTEKISAINTKIKNIEADAEFYSSLRKMTDGTEFTTGTENPTPTILENLRSESKDISDSYARLINQYRKQLAAPVASEADIEQIGSNAGFLSEKKKKLNITAPYDGVIGAINVREGEHVKAFTGIISFYELTPPMVTGYLNEKYAASIQKDDSLSVQSLYHPDKKVTGTVISKGHRIIEIPEKFRRVPEIKTYGVEVFIKINPENRFLQKEVLKITKAGN
jgi:multidrug resistance efflux pump